MKEVTKVLLLCPVFKDLSESEIEDILGRVHYSRRMFEKNEVLFNTGEESFHLGVILSGRLEMQKYLSSGNILSVFQRTEGEVLGGSMLFSSEPKYPCEVIAKDKSEILFIDKASVLEVLLKNTTVVSNMLRISADRIRQFEKRLELFSFYSIQKKIVFSLLHDFEAGNEDVVVLPFSKTTWAEYLNVSRPSLSRELKSLGEQGCIKMEGKRIRILQREMMEEVLW